MNCHPNVGLYPMNLLKEVLANEVFPAFGCTEPVSCAYAAAAAAAHLGEPVETLLLRADPGTCKNGAAVVVPHSGGRKGNLIAAALGAVLARPDAKLQLLQKVTGEILRQAQALCESGRCQLECLADCADFRVEVEVTGSGHRAVCILAGGHTHIERIERDGEVIPQAGTNEVVEITPPTCGKIRRQPPPSPSPREQLPAYRAALKQLNMAEVLALAETIDDEDRVYLHGASR